MEFEQKNTPEMNLFAFLSRIFSGKQGLKRVSNGQKTTGKCINFPVFLYFQKKMKKSEKNFKKGVDKRVGLCYYYQALTRAGHESGQQVRARTLKTIQRD